MNTPLSKPRLAHLRDVMQHHVTSGSMPGLIALVNRYGETHVETLGFMAFGGKRMTRDSIFRISSLTKPIAAAGAMVLVEDGKLRLDDPVDDFLPELRNRRVLRRLDGPVDDTVPANRPITLRDILTLRLGIGAIAAPPGTYPIQAAIDEAGVAPGPDPLTIDEDEFMKRLGRLPLMAQPGEAWLYHTGSDVLGVLIARASGHSLGGFLRERIFAPLGMNDTGFLVPARSVKRLTTAYRTDDAGQIVEFDAGGAASVWSAPMPFASAAGGLVSTADDYLAFCRMLLAGGKAGRTRVLSRPSVALMTSDQVTAAQRSGQELFLAPTRSWGFGMAVTVHRENVYESVGQFGWDGGYGLSAYSDPAEDLVGILLTQRMMDGPVWPAALTDFWTGAYQAIDD